MVHIYSSNCFIKIGLVCFNFSQNITEVWHMAHILLNFVAYLVNLSLFQESNICEQLKLNEKIWSKYGFSNIFPSQKYGTCHIYSLNFVSCLLNLIKYQKSNISIIDTTVICLSNKTNKICFRNYFRYQRTKHIYISLISEIWFIPSTTSNNIKENKEG
jgi:hypothetical protein